MLLLIIIEITSKPAVGSFAVQMFFFLIVRFIYKGPWSLNQNLRIFKQSTSINIKIEKMTYEKDCNLAQYRLYTKVVNSLILKVD